MASLRVLMIEDNDVDRVLWKRFLAQADSCEYEFAEETRGDAALQTYQTWRPDCVLLDFNLPDMDGIEFLNRLQSSGHSCAIVFATAFGSEQVAVRALKSGATDYLVKDTLTPDSLRRAVVGATEKHRLVRQVERHRLELEQRNRCLEESQEQVRAAFAREHEARTAAEASEARIRGLTEAIPQIVWTASRAGSLEYVNGRWTELTGASSAAAMGTGWAGFLHEADRAETLYRWRESAETSDNFEVECRLRTVNGDYRLQLLRGIALPLREGGAAWVGTLTDIEDQRRAAQLDYHRQKLESLGMLAGGIAHDFNNLLVGVMGGVSYALEVLSETDASRPMLEAALRASERAAHLVRQMLAYAGKGNYLMQRVDLAHVVASTCQLLRASISRTIQFQIGTGTDTPFVFADRSQMEQIVMNLVINAAEAIGNDQPGVITIRTGLEWREKPLVLSTSELAPGAYVTMEVTDTGCGMDEQTKSRIFDPFYTTKFTGRGLGLAAVLGITRSNGGAVDVRSKPGAGSTFTVLLPAAAEAQEAAPATSDVQGSAVAGVVLVVDDEECVRRTAAGVLRRSGYQVHTAAGGRDALLIAGRAPSQFSAVLLDMSMPDLSGEETLRQLRNTGVTCPIVISSGHAEQEMYRRFGTDASAFLQKPYPARKLVETIASLHSKNSLRSRTANP